MIEIIVPVEIEDGDGSNCQMISWLKALVLQQSAIDSTCLSVNKATITC